ncbi:MAG: hypothetical protein J6U64_04470, partial [Alphaproteobacteria bacterium]|nr:hypothetical protein [Alphaproteobacteria bacterium]
MNLGVSHGGVQVQVRKKRVVNANTPKQTPAELDAAREQKIKLLQEAKKVEEQKAKERAEQEARWEQEDAARQQKKAEEAAKKLEEEAKKREEELQKAQEEALKQVPTPEEKKENPKFASSKKNEKNDDADETPSFKNHKKATGFITLLILELIAEKN